MTQVLTLKDGLPKVRAALTNRTLGAFEFNDCQYQYEDGISGCAIGVMLNPETIAKIHRRELNGTSLGVLIECGVVHIPNPNERHKLALLQMLHDSWAGDEEPDPASAEALCEQIGWNPNGPDYQGSQEVFTEYLTWLEQTLEA